MTNQQIIEAVRALSKGLSVETDIHEILSMQGCDYLLTKAENPAQKKERALTRVVNSIAIKERFKACAPLFLQSEIPYAVIKGAVLSQTVYGDPLIRTSGDIDVLIRREDADRLKRLLSANGFVQGRITDGGIVPFSRRELLFQAAMSHQTAPYVKATGNRLCPYVNVDVNMDILWGERGARADMDFVLSYTEKSSLCNVSFQKLMPEIELLSLCLHHYKDMNSLYLLSSGSLRLGLFCEIYDYLQNVKPDVAQLSALCNQLNVGRYVYVCLHQTQQIFEDMLLNPYLEALEPQKDDTLLNTFGLSEKEQKQWEIDLFERLFHPNLAEYIQGMLSDEEKEKIKINRQLM